MRRFGVAAVAALLLGGGVAGCGDESTSGSVTGGGIVPSTGTAGESTPTTVPTGTATPTTTSTAPEDQPDGTATIPNDAAKGGESDSGNAAPTP
ncbi:hypothetical protein DSM112329_01886 [Paraconexibacter sp. AEG42_29]|uniref:Uncharacterized protein n=1 Tax=Paraconexibacter sp. AEG42_29 TaxID=2997339 RepID=A0AAU7ATS4_9ACTN